MTLEKSPGPRLCLTSPTLPLTECHRPGCSEPCVWDRGARDNLGLAPSFVPNVPAVREGIKGANREHDLRDDAAKNVGAMHALPLP